MGLSSTAEIPEKIQRDLTVEGLNGYENNGDSPIEMDFRIHGDGLLSSDDLLTYVPDEA